MLRIECSCGKILKVNETLIGKKIKCPGCAAIQLVKNGPSTATAASPKSAPQAEEHMAPAVKKKSPVAAASKSPAPQKRRFREDHEDDEEPLPRKKAAKKGGSKMLLLLIGGGAFVVLLAVLAVGAWLLLSGDDKKVAGTPANKSTGGAPKGGGEADQVAIKFFVPHKVGDRREFKVVAAHKSEKKWQDASKLPPQFMQNMGLLADSKEEKSTLHGSVTTLTVNDKGEETKIELALTQIKIQLFMNGKSLNDNNVFPEKAVVFGTRVGPDFIWTDADGEAVLFKKWLRPCVADEYMDLNEVAADRMFGGAEKRSPGDTWPVNKDAIDDTLKKQHAAKAEQAKGVVTNNGELRIKDGFAKLTDTSDSADKHVDVEIRLDWTVVGSPLGLEERGVNFTVSLPRDRGTGPVKKVARMDANAILKMPLKPYGRPNEEAVLKSTISETVTTEIKYLAKASGADKTQKPKDKGIDIGAGKKEQKPAQGVPVAFNLFVPHKVGEQREIHMVEVGHFEKKFADEAKAPPEMKKLIEGENRKEKTTLHGIVTTLEVNARGEETKVLVELKDVNIEDMTSKDGAPKMPKEGKVLYTRKGESFDWSHPDGGPSLFPHIGSQLNYFLGHEILGLPASHADEAFSTQEKLAAGEIWRIDKSRIGKAIKDDIDTQGKNKTMVDITAAKANATKSIGDNGQDFVNVEIDYEAALANDGTLGGGKIDGTMKLSFAATLPADASHGFVKKSEMQEMRADIQYSLGGEVVLVKGHSTLSVITHVKYLGQASKLDPSTAKETKTDKGDAVAIKLFVPHKKGDVREVKFSAEVKVDLHTPDLAKLPEETKTLLTSANVREKITLHAKVQTLEVNERGEETKVSLTIVGGDIKETGAQKHFGDNPVVPKGAVVIGVQNGTSFDWSIPGGTLSNDLASYLSTLVSNKFLEQPEITSDKLFGTDQKQVEGGAWPINKALLEKINQQAAMKDPGGGPDKAPQVDGSAKLFQIVTEGGKRYLDVEIKAKMSVSDGTFVMATENKLRLPDDGSTGPLKRAEKMTMSVGQAVSLKVPAGQPPIVTTLTTVTEYYTFTEIAYLGNFPIKGVK